jgi:hypothetical protein
MKAGSNAIQKPSKHIGQQKQDIVYVPEPNQAV